MRGRQGIHCKGWTAFGTGVGAGKMAVLTLLEVRGGRGNGHFLTLFEGSAGDPLQGVDCVRNRSGVKGAWASL